MNDYVSWIRDRIGHDRIFLNVAIVVVVNDKGEVLLQKRSKTESRWGFPGGVIELGESADEAAVREAREETGLEVQIENLLGVYTRYYDEYANGDKAQPVAIVFTGSAIGGKLATDNNETFELSFFAPDTAPTLFNAQHNDILEDFRLGRTGVYR